jgi:hypothetical protein
VVTGIPAPRSLFPGPALLIALALGNALLLAPAGSLPRVCGAGIILLLPGLAWAHHLLRTTDRLTVGWSAPAELYTGYSHGKVGITCLALFLGRTGGPGCLVLIPMLGLGVGGAGAPHASRPPRRFTLRLHGSRITHHALPTLVFILF